MRLSRSGAVIFIECESRDTTETWTIAATQPRSFPMVVQPRRRGTEYRADHADGPGGGDLYLVTNAGATEFRLVKAPVTAPGADGWTEVVPPSADTRLVACDAFDRYLVLTERRGAATQLRVLPVTVAYRAGFGRDGTAPCLLYGYGAYEACSWPEFSLPAAGRAAAVPPRAGRRRPRGPGRTLRSAAVRGRDPRLHPGRGGPCTWIWQICVMELFAVRNSCGHKIAVRKPCAYDSRSARTSASKAAYCSKKANNSR